MRHVSTSGDVTTIAGSPGVPGGADGSGVAARFDTPSGIAILATGALIVSDRENHAIRRGVPTNGATATLTVTRAGTGQGSVESLPAGIACGADCSDTLPPGTLVSLTATAALGSVFTGWSGGGCTATALCVTAVGAATTVTATFAVAPPPTYTRFLAEGATSGFFDTRIALLNPTDTATTATLSFLKAGATPIVTQVAVGARTRVTVDPKLIAGLAVAEFATRVESSVPLVVDRTLSWDVASGYGAHAETAVAAPSLTWYLAEGATHSGFNLFYLLQNPNPEPAFVDVRYLRPSGDPLVKTYILAPDSRTNIWVNVEEFDGLGTALASTDVSAVFEVTNGQPIIVERALYLDRGGVTFAAGHESAGVTTPATDWFLAEGATGDYFDLFILVANPNPTETLIEETYLLPDGTTVERSHMVPGNSRMNIWVDVEDPRLANTAVSTTITSVYGEPIIVERALWWPGGFSDWYEAHNSPGAVATGTRWALAEGEVGGGRNTDTYILIANTATVQGQVRATLLFEDGTTAERTFDVAAKSRFNVDVRSEFPSADGRRFGAVIESLGRMPIQIVVERAMYWNAIGQTWASGTNALATRLQ
ncbi:MAG: hypothetical protein JNM38_00540 [Acidobacteria bacterium]|nr:hypothetical protein [Acidobacteriota bacterium]